MRDWYTTKHCRLCGEPYKCAKDENKDGFCCDWCRVMFYRLCGALLRTLRDPGSSQAKSRNKSRAKREKKFLN